MLLKSWVATAEWVRAVQFFFQVFFRCSSLFFSGVWLLFFISSCASSAPFGHCPWCYILVEGCNQTSGICLPRSVAATIVTVISDLYIQIIMICRVAFVPLLLYTITCRHLRIIHTLVS